MKAEVERIGKTFLLNLTPENTLEAVIVKGFGEELNRPHIINHRGFKYKMDAVEFLIQPYSGDS